MDGFLVVVFTAHFLPTFLKSRKRWEAERKGDLMALWLNRAGLFMNVVGSILIAISFGRPESEAYQNVERHWLAKAIGMSPTRRQSLAAFTHPVALYAGIVLVILGFSLSLCATFSN